MWVVTAVKYQSNQNWYMIRNVHLVHIIYFYFFIFVLIISCQGRGGGDNCNFNVAGIGHVPKAWKYFLHSSKSILYPCGMFSMLPTGFQYTSPQCLNSMMEHLPQGCHTHDLPSTTVTLVHPSEPLGPYSSRICMWNYPLSDWAGVCHCLSGREWMMDELSSTSVMHTIWKGSHSNSLMRVRIETRLALQQAPVPKAKNALKHLFHRMSRKPQKHQRWATIC